MNDMPRGSAGGEGVFSAAARTQATVPLTFSQVLERVFQLMRSNFRLFIGIAAIPAVVYMLMFGALFAIFFLPILLELPKTPEPEQFAGMFIRLVPAFFLINIVQYLVFALFLPAAIDAAMKADAGLHTTFRDAYRGAFDRAGRYILLLLLIYLVSFFPALVIELGIFLGGALAALGKVTVGPALILMLALGWVLFHVAMVYATITAMRLALAFPACVAEGLTATAALKRSGHLTQGAKGRIFLVLLIVYAASYVIFLVVGCVLMALIAVAYLILSGFGIDWTLHSIVAGASCAGIVFMAAMILYMAVMWAGVSTALAVFYRDQRLRKNGVIPMASAAGGPA
jgi:hypothetical protein